MSSWREQSVHTACRVIILSIQMTLAVILQCVNTYIGYFIRVFVFESECNVMFWSSAGATPRTDEKELGGAVQRAGGEETSLWGREGQLGSSAENPGAAETGCLQVSNTEKLFNSQSPVCFLIATCALTWLFWFLTQDNGEEQEERKNLLKRDTSCSFSFTKNSYILPPLWSSHLLWCSEHTHT